MRVLVTGGTGFIGAHTIAALLRAGHEVRMLVRTPAKIGPALEPLGVPAQPFVVGDATDAAAVNEAMEGCDALLHAASVYNMDIRLREETLRTNLVSTEVVLGTAAAVGLDPIVYVSSFNCLLSGPGQRISPDSPVGHLPSFYPESKAAAERVARRLQDEGAPVVITYPGSVHGPHYPALSSESARQLLMLLRRTHQPALGGIPIVDVRDVAAAHAALMEPGRGPRRYLLSGHRTSWREVIEQVAAITGRTYRVIGVPAGPALRAARIADATRRVLPLRLPINSGVVVLAADPECDDSATLHDLPVTFRPLRETIHDAIAALHAGGHITDAQAGRVITAV